jgi:hypothetical protein
MAVNHITPATSKQYPNNTILELQNRSTHNNFNQSNLYHHPAPNLQYNYLVPTTYSTPLYLPHVSCQQLHGHNLDSSRLSQQCGPVALRHFHEPSSQVSSYLRPLNIWDSPPPIPITEHNYGTFYSPETHAHHNALVHAQSGNSSANIANAKKFFL